MGIPPTERQARQSISYRELTALEIAKLCEIDRRETRDGHYVMVAGQLALVAQPWEHPGFSPEQVEHWIARLRTLQAQGGVVIGAVLCDTTLLGMAAVCSEHCGRHGEHRRLEFLHVSRPYRGQGIGKRLLLLAQDAARTLGARQLYITASSTQSTVAFYQRQGCRLAAEIDPVLFAEEPCDIHLELDVSAEPHEAPHG